MPCHVGKDGVKFVAECGLRVALAKGHVVQVILTVDDGRFSVQLVEFLVGGLT